MDLMEKKLTVISDLPEPIVHHIMSFLPTKDATQTSTLSLMEKKLTVISDLPEPIVHHIMSFLPTKDATQTSALSRTWRSDWESFPIIDLDQTAFEKPELFEAHLTNSLQRLEKRSTNIDKFRLQLVSPIGAMLSENIKTAIQRALELHVQELVLIQLNEQETYKFPGHCLSSGKSLTCLKVMGFEFEFGLVENVLLGCPLIEDLTLQGCKASSTKTAKFSSEKLKRLELGGWKGLESIQLCAPNLQSFSYSGSRPTERCKMDLTGCEWLKNLTVKYVDFGDQQQWFEEQISGLAHLENLALSHCHGLKGVKIVHDKLRSLILRSCCELVEAEIDCPKLRWFTYKGEIVEFGFLNSSGCLEATLELHCFHRIDRPFVKLTNLLRLFGHCKELTLMCSCNQDLIFPEEVKCSPVPPLLDLKHLKVECNKPRQVDHPNFVDSLLCLSPHLETLIVPSYQLDQSVMKFYFTRMAEKEESCVDQRRLRKVKIDHFDGSASYDIKQCLFKYFPENAKVLESIEDNSTTFEVIEGEHQ